MRRVLSHLGPPSDWLHRPRELVREGVEFLRFTVRNYFDDGCLDRAGHLTYLTMFAVVPLLTLIYTMLSLVPAFGEVQIQIQDFIYEYLLPTTVYLGRRSRTLRQRQREP